MAGAPHIWCWVRERSSCWCPSSGSASGTRRTRGGRCAAMAGRRRRTPTVRTRAFWALCFAYLCTPLAVFPVVTHQVAFAVDQGFPRLFVAGIFGLTGLLSVVGRLAFRIAAGRVGRAGAGADSVGCPRGG